jgi:hypothetical protein
MLQYKFIAKRMVKKVLIPTDFKIESLNTLKYCLEERKQEKASIILMYSAYNSDSITELLFYNPTKIVEELISPNFKDAINIIKNTYESSIQSFRINLFHGLNTNAFLNFYEANQIDLVYLPKNYCLNPFKNGFDPIPLIKRSKVQYSEVAWTREHDLSDKDDLNQLFK